MLFEIWRERLTRKGKADKVEAQARPQAKKEGRHAPLCKAAIAAHQAATPVPIGQLTPVPPSPQ